MSRVEVIGNATLYLGDCLSILPELSDIDAVITDPPYSSGGAFRGDRAQSTTAKYVQSDSGNQSLPDFSGDNRDQRSFHFWSALWGSAALHACKPSAIACFFTDWRQLPVSTDYLQAAGFVWRGIVPWVKTTYRPQMGRFGAQCEYVVWGSAGPLPTERGVGCLAGFFNCASPSSREHVTQKPIELMDEIVEIAPPGGLILDPFMGSGTTGVSALKLGRRFIGIEVNEEYFDIACRRLEAENSQAQLFAPPEPEQADAFGGGK